MSFSYIQNFSPSGLWSEVMKPFPRETSEDPI